MNAERDPLAAEGGQVCQAIVALAADANRFIEEEAPWKLAKAADDGDADAAQRFEDGIHVVLSACSAIADALTPFVPAGAQRLRDQLAAGGAKPAAAFPRLAGGDFR